MTVCYNEKVYFLFYRQKNANHEDRPASIFENKDIQALACNRSGLLATEACQQIVRNYDVSSSCHSEGRRTEESRPGPLAAEADAKSFSATLIFLYPVILNEVKNLALEFRVLLYLNFDDQTAKKHNS